MSVTKTSIAWSDATWNVTRGCRRISPGCGGAAGEGGCYAERQAYRFSGDGMPYEGLVQLGKQGPRWTGRGRLALTKLFDPLRLKKRHKIFVNSMSDLFFEAFTNDEIDDVLAVMLLAPEHTFQVLTKRHDRMQAYLANPAVYPRVLARANVIRQTFSKRTGVGISDPSRIPAAWVWWGVSVENQEYADKRIPALLATPAAVRFVSYEPALGPVDFRPWLSSTPKLDLIIVGGESGPGARPFDVRWAHSVVEQCRDAGVSVFCKQLGSNPHDSSRSIVGGWAPGDPEPDTRLRLKDRKGEDMNEWDEELRIQQWPRGRSAA